MQLDGGGGGVGGCSATKMEKYLYLFFLATVLPGLWWIEFFPLLLLLVPSHVFASIFSAPDISSDLKHSYVFCGDGSRLVALDILVLCLLCCFTAHYKAKMSWKTWGHNCKNVIIQQMEAFSFLLITPVVSLLCFYSLLAATFLICCLFSVNMVSCLSVTLAFTTENENLKKESLVYVCTLFCV